MEFPSSSFLHYSHSENSALQRAFEDNKAHNLDQLLDGDVDALFDALSAADKQSRLQQA